MPNYTGDASWECNVRRMHDDSSIEITADNEDDAIEKLESMISSGEIGGNDTLNHEYDEEFDPTTLDCDVQLKDDD